MAAQGFIGQIAGAGRALLSSVRPFGKWVSKIWNNKYTRKLGVFKELGLSFLEYKAGDIIQKLGNSKQIRQSRQGTFSSSASDNSAQEIIPKARERAKREANELSNIAQFTSTSLKKDYEVAARKAQRNIDMKEKKLTKNKRKSTSELISDVKYKVSKKSYDNKVISPAKATKDNSIDQVGNIKYRDEKVVTKNKDTEEVIKHVGEKLAKQDEASSRRDKLAGATLATAIAASGKEVSDKVRESDRKTTSNIQKLDESVKTEEESTRKLIADEGKSTSKQIDATNDSIQEIAADSVSTITQSNSDGLKAISEQLYESEKAEEDRRVDEIKRMNESDAKIDELIDSNNILYNTTRTLDRTNMLLANVAADLKKPAGLGAMIQEGMSAFAYMLGGFFGTIKGVLASLPATLGMLVNVVLKIAAPIAKGLVLLLGMLGAGFLKGLQAVIKANTFGLVKAESLGRAAKKVFEWPESYNEKIDKSIEDITGQLDDWGARKSEEWLEKLSGIGGNQYLDDRNTGPAPAEGGFDITNKDNLMNIIEDEEIVDEDELKERNKQYKKDKKKQSKGKKVDPNTLSIKKDNEFSYPSRAGYQTDYELKYEQGEIVRRADVSPEDIEKDPAKYNQILTESASRGVTEEQLRNSETTLIDQIDGLKTTIKQSVGNNPQPQIINQSPTVIMNPTSTPRTSTFPSNRQGA